MLGLVRCLLVRVRYVLIDLFILGKKKDVLILGKKLIVVLGMVKMVFFVVIWNGVCMFSLMLLFMVILFMNVI